MQNGKTENGQDFLSQVNTIISRNLENENFGAGELADELGLSMSQTLRRIKKESGLGANQYIREIRLEYAAALLDSHKDLNVSEIAFKAGFSSPSYFIKCFHDKYNATPGAYKTHKTKGKRHSRILIGVISAILIFLMAGAYLVRWTGTEQTVASSMRSIAVLPLLDATSDQRMEYLSAGLTDDLTYQLAKFANLRVVSRGSAMLYRDSAKLYRDIAAQLGVDLLLEGSVMQKGEDLQMIFQLIEPVPEEKHLWTAKYEVRPDDIFNIPGVVAKAIGTEMAFQEPGHSVTDRHVDPEAYDHYLRGMYLLDKQNPVAVQQAIEHCRASISTDSTFAPAYALMAKCYISMNRFIRNNEEKLQNKQRGKQMIYTALDKAIETDRSLAEAYIAYGYVLGTLDWDWDGMKSMVDKGLMLNPNSSAGYLLLSDYWAINGDMAASLEAARKAVELDPLNPYAGTMLAQKLEVDRQYGQALIQYEKVLELFPEYGMAWNGVGFSHFLLGDKEKARECWGQLHEIMGNREMADYFQDAQFDNAVRHWLQEATKTQKLYCSNPSVIAMAFMLHDHRTVALEYLEYSYTMRNEELPLLILHPVFDSLRGTLPFEMIVQQLNVEGTVAKPGM